MLGVLKRHLKPKRAREEKESQNSRRNVHNKSDAIVPVDVARLAPSQRQIHPLFDDKAQLLAYDDSNVKPKIPTPTPNIKKSAGDPLPYSLAKRSPIEPVLNPSHLHPLAATTPSSTFHPAPNICVEGGRIEFIKSPSEGSNLASLNPPRGCIDKKTRQGCLSQCVTTPDIKSVAGITRAQQTEPEFLDFGAVEEKCDFAKEVLEAKIKKLQRLLECEQEAVQKEKLAVSRLQKQLSKRDATQRDVDRERRLRADTESRLRETVSESERYRESLAGLQREFSKMEDTVKSMLQYKTRCELLNQEKVFLTAIYESRVVQYQNKITKLEDENDSLKQRLRLLENIETEDISTELLERLRSLETENANLFQDADFQRKQYERCLDDIANQVVRALLSQKGLREEIGNLQRKIKELENQNHALAEILMSKIDKGSAVALPSTECITNDEKNGFEMFPGTFPGDVFPRESPETSSSTNFNFKVGERKRLQRLNLSDLGDNDILNTLNPIESLIVVPVQRPRSLSLHFQTSPMAFSAATGVSSKRNQNKKGKLNLVTLSKKPSEDEGNESPESGNRDEGYSTMSSDVQGIGETSELSRRELEDLKEASDETDVIVDSSKEMTSTVVVEDITDPDIFFLPLNLSLTINSRQSYPPTKNFLPFQHAMRSFSDSHLCLKLTSSTIPSSVSPSVFLLKKSKVTSNFSNSGKKEKDAEDSESTTGSWCSGNWWDTEFFQHWLKLDDTRLKHQQHRDMLQLQYDRAEIEEWSMTLSCEDVAKSAEGESPYISEISELKNKPDSEVDSIQYGNYKSLILDIKAEDVVNCVYDEDNSKKSVLQMSPNGSWCSESSNSEDCCSALNNSYFNDSCGIDSKNSPIVSDDGEESSTIDIDFTRDFYRLVKFESTKSLTSNSSKSNSHCNLGLYHQKQSEFAQEREMALQSVLSFIVEQQKYCHNREEKDIESESYCVLSSVEKHLNESNCSNGMKNDNEYNYYCDNDVEAQEPGDITVSVDHPEKSQVHLNACDLDISLNQISDNTQDDLGKKCILVSNKNSGVNTCGSNFLNESVNKKANRYKKNSERQIITKLPVRNLKKKSLVQHRMKNDLIQEVSTNSKSLKPTKATVKEFKGRNQTEENKTLSHGSKFIENSTCSGMSDSFESSVVTSETPTKKKTSGSSPSNKSRETLIPVLSSKKQSDSSCYKPTIENKISRPMTDSRTKGTKIPVICCKKTEPTGMKKPGDLNVDSVKPVSSEEPDEGANTSLSAQGCAKSTSVKSSSPGSPCKVVNDSSFHEKATTKDVINELNKMIRKGEELTPNNGEGELKPLDMACCCPTGWIHVERNIDFTDPKARANLLDVMLASSGSSSRSESSSDSGGDEPVAYSHLHRLHMYRRQRKASATREQLAVLRYSLRSVRPTLIGRENFFVRYGDKEKEAIATFDFLEDISTTSVSGCSSFDSLESSRSKCLKPATSPFTQEPPSPEIDICTPVTPTTPATPSDDSDERTGGPVSLSDSCVESYPESVGSLEEQ